MASGLGIGRRADGATDVQSAVSHKPMRCRPGRICVPTVAKGLWKMAGRLQVAHGAGASWQNPIIDEDRGGNGCMGKFDRGNNPKDRNVSQIHVPSLG